jgi:hypothetical protein
VRGAARALGADRVLDHLDHDLLAVAQQLGDRGHGWGWVCPFSAGSPSGIGRAGDVGGVQERGALEPDLDERRLHARA